MRWSKKGKSFVQVVVEIQISDLEAVKIVWWTDQGSVNSDYEVAVIFEFSPKLSKICSR